MIEDMHLLNIFNNKKYQTGQIGIIIILMMVVILTVGLSIASQSSKTVDITSEDEAATIAFHSAESGIEQALSDLYQYERTAIPYQTSLDSTDLRYSIAESTTLEMKISEGYSVQLPLNNSTSLGIEWSDNNTCNNTTAALLISIFLDDAGAIKAQHYAVDGCATRASTNNFISANDSAGTYNFRHTINSAALTLEGTPLFARITPIYANTHLLVSGLSATAQYDILSSGRNQNEQTKSINVDRTIPAAPAFMNYTLVSGGSITK